MKILYLGYIYTAAGAAWRIICLFRKEGSCRFRRCPFRKKYDQSSCVYFPSGGCVKCPPTESEWEVYKRTADGILESMMNKGGQDS